MTSVTVSRMKVACFIVMPPDLLEMTLRSGTAIRVCKAERTVLEFPSRILVCAQLGFA
jgi:hypothetical protein